MATKTDNGQATESRLTEADLAKAEAIAKAQADAEAAVKAKAKPAPDAFDRFYSRARKAGGGVIPVECLTAKGKITLNFPLPETLDDAGCIAEAKSKGYDYTIPTKGTVIGLNGIAKNAKGSMSGGIAVEAATDILNSTVHSIG